MSAPPAGHAAEAGSGSRARLLFAASALVALALALRLYGIAAGLPDVHQIDEPSYSMHTGELDWGGMRPKTQLSPTGYPYSIVALRTVIGWSDALESRLRALAGAADNEAYHALLGRLISALFGALAVLPVFLLGLRLSGRTAAVCAGLLMAVDFLHVRQSHWGTPDVLMVSFVMAGVLASVACVSDGRRRWVLLAGLCAGLATVVKLPGLLVLLGVGLALLLAPRPGRSWWRRLLDGALAAAVAGAVFLLVDPYALLDSATFLRDTQYILGHANYVVEGQPPQPVLLVYLKALWYGGGPVVCVVALLGTLTVLRAHERRREVLLVLLLPAIYLAYMSTKASVYLRYTMLLVPFVALFAGLGLELLARRWSMRARRLLVPACVLALAAWPLAHSLRFGVLQSRPDTRELANEWLAANLARREYVLLDALTVWLPPGVLAPPVRLLCMPWRFRELLDSEGAGGRRPRYLVSEDWIADFWDPVQVQQHKSNAEQVAQEVRDFYDMIDKRFALAASFQAAPEEVPFFYEQMYGPYDHLWSLERPGPGVRIYDLKQVLAPTEPTTDR
jgi:hypothetical protein